MVSMLTAALFTIAMIWKQFMCTLMNECLEKMWCVCVCVCVRACTCVYVHSCNGVLFRHKRIEILPFVTTKWREDIMLSEIT